MTLVNGAPTANEHSVKQALASFLASEQPVDIIQHVDVDTTLVCYCRRADHFLCPRDLLLFLSSGMGKAAIRVHK